jgi:membrane-bound metal-dependent hydrolase YbcI (DUF457 family)
MDPVTHGITGALLGKGYLSERYGRVAIFAVVLGSVFPDIDVFAGIFTRDPLAIVKYHRAITHSFVALPFFALVLAFLTRAAVPWVKRRYERFRDIESPSWLALTLAYGVGIASHIFLDGMTSFGTRIWFPVSRERAAWDLLFIIDFGFTAIVLLPQIVPWIYSDGARARARAIRMWVVFTLSGLAIWGLTCAAGFPFHFWVAVLISALLAVVFFGPAVRAWGFGTTRAGWCQMGTLAMVGYLFACSLAHHAAILRAKAFADQNHIVIDRIAALPIPPSLLSWGDAIRSPDGLFEAQLDLRDSKPPAFNYIADSPPDAFIQRAFQLPEVKLYWEFARFPSIHSFVEENHHVVELGENRFGNGRRRSTQPFTYEVVFDIAGNVIEEGWVTNGLMQRRIRRMVPQPPIPAKNRP